MLKSAEIKNFGCLPNETYKFSKDLNVIIGENGLGKSQLLKLLYATLKVNSDESLPNKNELQKMYAEKLVGVFRPDGLGRLVKRRKGNERCEISLRFEDEKKSVNFNFSTRSSQVQIDKVPEQSLDKSPAFFPTRELITLSPWFVSLFDNYHLRFEESWRDTVSLLGAPALKGPREKAAAELLAPLEQAMGGKVYANPTNGNFYLSIPGEGDLEMPLVAEGLRKFAMLARLISTGVLLGQGYLFWDEPETNLNPKLVKVLARCILHLSKQGIQVFLATHSLFLLRELEILSAEKEFKSLKPRYFSFSTVDGKSPKLEQANSSSELDTIVILDEELYQSDRFMDLGDNFGENNASN